MSSNSARARHFDPITIAVEGGGRRRVHRITCSKCEATSDISANTMGGARAHVDILRIWTRAGWQIGTKPRHDECPNCQMAARKLRAPKDKPDAAPQPFTAEIIQMPQTTPAADPPADAPATMSREDKRIIYAQLETAYGDDATGYRDGWSDQRVATTLGVPRKWVEQIRAEFFGEVRSSEDVRKAMAEAADIAQRARQTIATVEKRKADLTAMGSRLDGLVIEVRAAIKVNSEAATAALHLLDDAIRIERKLADLQKALTP